MTTTNDESSPRARAIINAARCLVIPDEDIIGTLTERLGDAIEHSAMLANRHDALWAIASPLISSDDDFDDTIHEIAHEIDSTMPCDDCAAACDLCCDC